MAMARRSRLGIGALIGLAALFIGLTVLSTYALRGWRLDLTQNKLYTVAPGTSKILESLEEPVTLHYFWSAKAAAQYPPLKAYGTRVGEFLAELAARSQGKLRLQVIDPQPFSEDEDRAAEFGVRAVPIGGPGQQLYFGLAGTNSTDGREIIEFFDPGREEFLEYEVAKLIRALAETKKPVIAWLSSLPMSASMDPMTGQPREASTILAQSEQLFAVRELGPAIDSIAADVDVLVLVHPKSLPPATLQAIDQFALRGGRLLVFVDPLAEQDPAGGDPSNPMAAMTADRSSNLATLFAAWGVDFNAREVIGDLRYGMSVSMQPGGPPTRHIGILGLDAEALNEKDVITSGLSSLNVATTGALKARDKATTKFEPLVRSSDAAGVLPVERFAMLMDPGALQDGFKPSGARYTLAARITGNVKSAFPQNDTGGAPQAAARLVASAKPLNLIVFADTDMLADYLWVRSQNVFGQRLQQAWAGNGDLVWNAIENLAGGNDLISVRGRAAFSRPFERVEALRRDAEGRFRAKEQELQAELTATESKLTALQSQPGTESALGFTPGQEQELTRFQAERLRIRKELRDVRLGLDQEIRALGNRLKFANILIVPIVFAAIALLAGLWRRRRHAAILLVQKAGTP